LARQSKSNVTVATAVLLQWPREAGRQVTSAALATWQHASRSTTVKIVSMDYRVAEGGKVDLQQQPTAVKPCFGSKEEYQQHLAAHIAQLSSLQERLYAQGRWALLLIFQGIDAAGKDSAIQHVMSGVNPQGCEVSSFKQPSAEELAHDFLWRTTKRLPERGRIGIFNRSYYEEVLVVRVHPAILQGQSLPAELLDEKSV
jgi:polyphosphate kinase 2 (PPK2 family)